jgi:hypothetical protein
MRADHSRAREATLNQTLDQLSAEQRGGGTAGGRCRRDIMDTERFDRALDLFNRPKLPKYGSFYHGAVKHVKDKNGARLRANYPAAFVFFYSPDSSFCVDAQPEFAAAAAAAQLAAKQKRDGSKALCHHGIAVFAAVDCLVQKAACGIWAENGVPEFWFFRGTAADGSWLKQHGEIYLGPRTAVGFADFAADRLEWASVRALLGKLSARIVCHSRSVCMALLYGRTGCLTAKK